MAGSRPPNVFETRGDGPLYTRYPARTGLQLERPPRQYRPTAIHYDGFPREFVRPHAAHVSGPEVEGLESKEGEPRISVLELAQKVNPPRPANHGRLPREWPPRKKSYTVALVSGLNFLVNVAATMPSPGISDIMAETGTSSRLLVTFSVSSYYLGIATGPLILAPLSEIFGRLPVYTWTNFLWVYFTALCSVASQVPVLIVLRFFEGCVGSVPIVIGGGTIADMYPPETRGRAMSVYMLSAVMGPPLGPIMAAAITESLGWRWIFGCAAIGGAILTVLSFIWLEETHEPTVLRHERDKKRNVKKKQGIFRKPSGHNDLAGSEKLKESLKQPFKLLFTEQSVMLLGIYQAFTFGYIILMLTTFSSVFVGQYGFSTSTSGLPYLGIAGGFAVGVVISSKYSDRIASALARRNGGVRQPAYRLPLMVWSCWTPAVGLTVYGWSAYYKVQFMVPIIAVGLYSLGLQMIMVNIQVFLSEAHKAHVASAIAAVTVLRSPLGAALPLVGEVLYSKLGFGWGNTLLAFIAVAMMPMPYIVMRSSKKKEGNRRYEKV